MDTVLRTFEALIQIAYAVSGVSCVALGPLDLFAPVQDLFEIYASGYC